jgi:hypothetical protein
MAERKITGNSYLLFIDPAGGTSYDLVVCLLNFSLAATTASNDASSFCGLDSTPGDQSATIPFTAQTLLDPDDADQDSAPTVFDLWQDKTTIGWKIGPVTATGGDMTKTGQGFFSAYGENYDNNAVGQFSGTISVKGDITQTVTAS